MYAENWDVLLGKVIKHHICYLAVDIHQSKGLPRIEYAIELRVLVDKVFQKLSKLYVCKATGNFVFAVIIPECLVGFLVAVSVEKNWLSIAHTRYGSNAQQKDMLY